MGTLVYGLVGVVHLRVTASLAVIAAEYNGAHRGNGFLWAWGFWRGAWRGFACTKTLISPYKVRRYIGDRCLSGGTLLCACIVRERITGRFF